LLSTGKIPEAAKPCLNPAAEIVMIVDDSGPWIWEAMCQQCLDKYKVSPNVCTRKRHEQFKKACRAAKVTPEFAAKCVVEQYPVSMKCDRCGRSGPLLEHGYKDETMHYCQWCKAEAESEESPNA
jgi:hypothetical protein